MEYFSKSKLKNDRSYLGIHEDASVAKWDAEEGCFWYISLHKVIEPHPTLVELYHPDDNDDPNHSFKPITELYDPARVAHYGTVWAQRHSNTIMNGSK